ncbi:MAG: hypothetical protein MUF73_16465 [Rhodobacteraceae bacterium]|nr:hypothetical protein [Paracoccaceae bacterium]
MAKPTFDPVDTAAGALFVVLGAGFAWFGRGLEIGTTFRMGPGYFPLVLAGLLILLGLGGGCCSSCLRRCSSA